MFLYSLSFVHTYIPTPTYHLPPLWQDLELFYLRSFEMNMQQTYREWSFFLMLDGWEVCSHMIIPSLRSWVPPFHKITLEWFVLRPLMDGFFFSHMFCHDEMKSSHTSIPLIQPTWEAIKHYALWMSRKCKLNQVNLSHVIHAFIGTLLESTRANYGLARVSMK